MTTGQMSLGEIMCSTLEPPLGKFQQKGLLAIPEGQYPMTLDGDDIEVNIPEKDPVVLGRDIKYGLSNRGPVLLKQQEAQVLFHPAIVDAIRNGDDVLLDVVNPR
jgi:hypothetical protein